MVASTPLLSQTFVDRLCRLTWFLARRRADAGDRGLDVRRPGGTLDFQGHRPYSPGDDLRWIDWNALGRVDQAVVKIFSREEEQTVDILVDATASMNVGQPTKLDAARRLAAALGFLALHSRHRLRVGRLGGSRIALHGPFLGLETVPVFFSVLENLDSLVKTRDPRSKPILTTQAVDAQHGVSHGAGPLDEKGGSYEGINLVPAVAGEAEGGLRDYLSRVRRPGAVVVLSDGLEGETLAACLAHLGDVASESSFFQVLCPEEIRPELTRRVWSDGL